MSLALDSRIAWASNLAGETPESSQEAFDYLAGLMYAISEPRLPASASQFNPLEIDCHFWRGVCDGLRPLSVKKGWAVGDREILPAWGMKAEPFVLQAFVEYILSQDVQDIEEQPHWARPLDSVATAVLQEQALEGRIHVSGDTAQRLTILVYGESYGCILPEIDDVVRQVLSWTSIEKRKVPDGIESL